MLGADSRLWHWSVGGGRRELQVYFYFQKVVWQLTDREKLKQKVADLVALGRIRSHLKNQVTSGIATGSTAEHFIQGLGAIRHLVDTTISSCQRSASMLQEIGFSVTDLKFLGSLVGQHATCMPARSLAPAIARGIALFLHQRAHRATKCLLALRRTAHYTQHQ